MEKKYSSASELISIFMERNSEAETASDIWLHIVGEKLAGHCSLANIQNGIAYIEVDHPAVAQNVMCFQDDILKRINEKYESLNITKICTSVKKIYTQRNINRKQSARQTREKNSNDAVSLNSNLPPELRDIFLRMKKHSEK